MSIATRWEWVEARPVQRWALAVAGAGLGACALGAIWQPAQFFHSWLLAFNACLAFGLGSLALLMLHHLTGGVWGFGIRRMLEASSRTLPLMAVLFLPLLLGLAQNYPWAQSGGPHEIPHEQEAYYEVPFFCARAALYFAIWLVVMYLLNRWSAAHDQTGDAAYARRAQTFSGPGLILYGLTVTFAAVDWVMSLDAKWYSTIFGPVVALSQMLPALAVAIAAATFLATRKPLADLAGPALWNDLGNLLLAFVMLWTYVVFSQFLLIWSGNLPEEISYYVARSEGGWIWIAVALAVFNFILPFLMLLSRDIKRNPAKLRIVALAVAAMSFAHQFWMIAPAFSPRVFWLDWMDVAALTGMGGLWLAVFVWQIQQRPMLPVHHESFGEEALQHV
ncbi:MAG TPA: hypothetical protein VE988_16475 [Gemmataceae bacterium]|nr:hypothetical protein [Gemmataceae bacterium]